VSDFKALIDESRELEQRAAKIQGEKELALDDEAIDAIISDYHSWFGRCIDSLPAEFHERFRDEFEGGTWTTKIKDFLRAPGDKNFLYNETEPNPLVPSPWSNTYDTAFRGPLLAQRQILVEAQQLVEGAGQSSRNLELLERIFRRLPDFLAPLQTRQRERQPLVVEDEYDLQAVVHALLAALFDDVRPEDYVPERAGSRSRVDFLLKAERIVVETKMTRTGLGAKEVGEELIIDIERYKAHPSCDALVGLVFDPDRLIQNRRALEADLTRKTDGLVVRLYIVQ
jgi:hypothetical protein